MRGSVSNESGNILITWSTIKTVLCELVLSKN